METPQHNNIAQNSASQNFPHHLAVVRERMLHPTDYEKAVHYFLEEFAGDQAFVRASDVDSQPHFLSGVGSGRLQSHRTAR